MKTSQFYLNELQEIKKNNQINELPFVKASELIDFLVENRLFPVRISDSEDAICLTFVKGCNRIYFEIYNDGEMGYIIEDFVEKKILDNKNVLTKEELLEVLKCRF